MTNLNKILHHKQYSEEPTATHHNKVVRCVAKSPSCQDLIYMINTQYFPKKNAMIFRVPFTFTELPLD
uniref:Uncharacterized protein n=1 Tax=Anguilla anguilla TaxID=7936 RepID=A0A0E9SYW6_ANGAN